ncbi:hypothetical protein NUU61_006495 [Penicillium alfredii]|uniref:Uncharacterized protein n=1 Tax=Penicillium alfredii TaxID=1506179 RepID=A0A9W9F133_9EURO|nr:uncharacterized protein NUU61_006495 [Penicillium alfredii]KAJ5091625.1 hypothetical protein NUU61_006495 [Penicillium alfredii]
MHHKALAVLFLSATALATPELEKKQYGDSSDDYYSSLMSNLHSINLPSNYQDYMPSSSSDSASEKTTEKPTADDSTMTTSDNKPTGSGDQSSITEPPSASSMSIDMPPPSIQSVLMTAVPASFLSQMSNPSARSSIIHEIEDGNYPKWYQTLPASVKNWVSDHWATGAPTEGGSGSGGHNAASAPAGTAALGLMGAAGILALAVML